MVFRLLAWTGVFVTLLSRLLTGHALNPYLLFIGLPLVVVGLAGLIITWKET